MKQRITSLLLCFAMVLSLCTFLSFGSAAAEAEEIPTAPESAVWKGTVATGFAGGDGSASNPFVIADATQFAYFAAQVNAGVNADKHYKLVADIWCNDLSNFASWLVVDTVAVTMTYKAPANQITRIGTSEFPFAGNFDGDGYTIYGATYGADHVTGYAAIFEYVSGATIKNLNVEYAAFSTKGSSGVHNAAALVSIVTGNNLTTTIENCHVANSVLAASRKDAAGLIGSVGSNASLYMTNCSLENTTVLAGGAAAGLIGSLNRSPNGSYVCLTNCSVAGEIVAKGNASGLVGNHSQNAMIRADKCKNYASVTSTTACAGGFMPTSTNHSTGNRGDYFFNCANYGAITGATRAGGIVGELSQGNGVGLYIYNSYNEGAVKATAEGGYAGGMVGYMCCTGNAITLNIVSSVNMGTVEGTIKGGLVGFVTYNSGAAKPNVNGEKNYCGGAAFDASTDATLVANLSYAAIPSDLATLNDALNAYGEGKVYEVKDNEVVTMSATPTKWTLGVTVEYTVIFVDANGNEISRETVIAGNAVTTIPTVQAEEGFEFDAWVDAETGKKVNLEEVSGDATVKPAFKAAGPYVVTFLAKDGSLLKTEVVAWGASATAPEAPFVESYEFAGWDVAFDSVKSDITVTAKYTFTGTYFAGGRGTEAEPFLLATAQQLVDLSARVAEDTDGTFIAGHYKMIADIDLAGIKWIPIADFSGVFDGNGKTISNMQRAENSQYLAFFNRATGTIKNVTFTNVLFGATTSNGGNRAALAVVAYDALLVENCHVKDSEIRLNGTGALMIANVTAKGTATFRNCTVAGEVKGSANSACGGFVGVVDGSATAHFYDCTSFVVVTKDFNSVEGTAKTASGFVGQIYSNNGVATFTNCVFAGELYSAGQAGAFAAYVNGSGSSVTINNCSAYGTIRSKNNSAGGLIGSVNGYGTLNINNGISYATVSSDTKYAGGILGYVDGNNAKYYIENVISLSTVSCGNAETGAAGEIIGGIYQGTSASYVKCAYALTNNFVAFENETKSTTFEMYVLESKNALPEGLQDNPAWAIGATFDIAGISVTLGDNMSINVFAKTGIVIAANAGKLYVDGLYITAGDKVTIDGVDYVKFIYDGFKVADMDKVFALSLVCGTYTQNECVITDYIVNIYNAEDGKYQALLDAMLYYGDAAQKAKYGTSTVLASASLKLEKEFSLDIEALFGEANLKTHAGLSAVGMALDLSSNIIPVFTVGEGVEKVYVTIYGVTTEVTVVDGRAYFYGLNATSLNNLMTVSYTAADGTEVSFDTNVAMYIETALATEGLLTADKAALAKTLAVYMRAARTFVGLD